MTNRSCSAKSRAEETARVGLLFLDGDALEGVLLDPYGPTDYHFENFNKLKKVLMTMEEIDPGLDVSFFLWQKRPDNPDAAVAVVCGRTLPPEGWQKLKPNPALARALRGEKTEFAREKGYSLYFPVLNSDGEQAGALELLCESGFFQDI